MAKPLTPLEIAAYRMQQNPLLGNKQMEAYLTSQLSPENWATWKSAQEAEKASKKEQDLEEFMLAELGLKYNDKGELTKMTEEEQLALMTESEREEYEIGGKMRERQLMALEGRLPISPALEEEFGEQQKLLDVEMSSRLGSGWQTSTPGIQSRERAASREGLLREEARRGLISQSEALSQGRRGIEGQLQGQRVGQYTQMPYTRMPLMNIYSGIGDYYQRERDRKAREKAGLYGAWGSLFGSAMGAGATAYAGR